MARGDYPVQMIPCTVTTVSPLTVQLATGGTVSGTSLAGASYSVGTAAIALLRQPGKPLILPIGA